MNRLTEAVREIIRQHVGARAIDSDDVCWEVYKVKQCSLYGGLYDLVLWRRVEE